MYPAVTESTDGSSSHSKIAFSIQLETIERSVLSLNRKHSESCHLKKNTPSRVAERLLQPCAMGHAWKNKRWEVAFDAALAFAFGAALCLAFGAAIVLALLRFRRCPRLRFRRCPLLRFRLYLRRCFLRKRSPTSRGPRLFFIHLSILAMIHHFEAVCRKGDCPSPISANFVLQTNQTPHGAAVCCLLPPLHVQHLLQSCTAK